MMPVRASPAQFPLIEWGERTFKLDGEQECGDVSLVRSGMKDALIAVLDGAGHGSQAAAAANLAVSTIEKFAGESVLSLVGRCHEKLKGTRGVVMSLAAIDGVNNEMTWVAVGNVESFLVRRNPDVAPGYESIFLRAGVVGYKLPPLQAFVLPIASGDTLIFVTDGIRTDFVNAVKPDDPPQKIANWIGAEHAKGNDDGLVLVVRYNGLR